jgi:hypothetical protein
VDGPTQWPLRNFKPLLEELVCIAKASKVQGLGFRVQGLGFRVQGSGFRIRGLGTGFSV